MLSTLRVVTPPALPSVPLAIVRQHVRVDNTDDDGLLGLYLESATQTIESFLGRVLISTVLSWDVMDVPIANVSMVPAGNLLVLPLAFSGLSLAGRALELPRAPVQQVLSFRMGVGADAVDIAANRYSQDLGQDPARLRLLNGLSLSGSLYGSPGFSVTFRAGYGDNPSAIPAPIRHALLLLTSYGYERRGDDGGEMPSVIERLLWPYRMMTFGG